MIFKDNLANSLLIDERELSFDAVSRHKLRRVVRLSGVRCTGRARHLQTPDSDQTRVLSCYTVTVVVASVHLTARWRPILDVPIKQYKSITFILGNAWKDGN